MCKSGHDLHAHARLRTLRDGRVKRECRRCEAARHAKGTAFYARHPRANRAGGGPNGPYATLVREAFGPYADLLYRKD